MNGKRILLVEDDEFVRSLVETQLETLGYEVTCADDASTALASHVRERWPDVPILVASGDAADRAAARAVGAPRLQKPYVLDELERKIDEAVGGARRLAASRA